MCSLFRFRFRLLTAARRCSRLAVPWVLFFGAGCSRSYPGQKPAATVTNVPGAAAVRLLGNVHVIGTGGRFVLVEASVPAAAASLTDGQTLICRAAGADSATLRVSHERRPPFVVADVVGGEPRVGDEVFVAPASGPAATPVPGSTPQMSQTNPSPTPAT